MIKILRDRLDRIVDGRPGEHVAVQPDAEVIERLRDALRLIAGPPNHCESFTGRYTCRDKYSGKSRDDRTIADGWCDACIAADGLGLPTGETQGGERRG